MWNLSQRDLCPERMDEPDLPVADHESALAALARINALSGSARILWPALRDLARSNAGRPLRVLDVATGGGDVPITLAGWFQRRGLACEIAGCDRSPTALALARRRAEQAGVSVTFFEHDALATAWPTDFDVHTSSLFLHHLSAAEAAQFLQSMSSAARRAILVNDLHRCQAGYALAWTVSRILTRSPIVHEDAPQSVAAAFTMAEALALAQCVGLTTATIRRRWPYRWLLDWRRTTEG